MGIVSLILAIATVVLSLFFPYISVLTGIIGIVLGIVEMNRRKKIGGKKVLPVFGIVVSAVGIALSILISALVIFTISKEGSIYGKWYCQDKDIYLEIDKNGNFEFYTSDKNTIVIKATYTMEKDTTDQKYPEYILTVSAKERTIDGKKLTSSYTTKFSLILGDDSNTMAMMNWMTYSMYEFVKVK